MQINKARELIKELENYVLAYETYQPKNMKQEAIKIYAELNNVNKVASELNDKGYRKEGKLVAGKRAQVKLKSNDITKLIDSDVDPDDQLHDIIKKILNRNRKRKGIVT